MEKTKFPTHEEVEKAYFNKLAVACKGHRGIMSLVSGISIRTIHRKINQHGVTVGNIIRSGGHPMSKAAEKVDVFVPWIDDA